jgi:hypothetical protein
MLDVEVEHKRSDCHDAEHYPDYQSSRPKLFIEALTQHHILNDLTGRKSYILQVRGQEASLDEVVEQDQEDRWSRRYVHRSLTCYSHHHAYDWQHRGTMTYIYAMHGLDLPLFYLPI